MHIYIYIPWKYQPTFYGFGKKRVISRTASLPPPPGAVRTNHFPQPATRSSMHGSRSDSTISELLSDIIHHVLIVPADGDFCRMNEFEGFFFSCCRKYDVWKKKIV